MSKNNELLNEFNQAALKMALRIKSGDDKSILNPAFKYTPSSKTDISKTFAKARKELKNSTTNQESLKPLVSPTLNPNGFVLSEEWFQLE